MEGKIKKKVLIVDNNERVLYTVQELLEDSGFDTRTTWSGQEALELLATRDFDVLVVDDYLPDLHAGEFLRRVQGLPMQPWVVVMEGTLPTRGDVTHYAVLGASAVVDKRRLRDVRRAVQSLCVEEPLVKAPTGDPLARTVHRG